MFYFSTFPESNLHRISIYDKDSTLAAENDGILQIRNNLLSNVWKYNCKAKGFQHDHFRSVCPYSVMTNLTL